MNYRFETEAHDLIRVTDGVTIRFIPADSENTEYRKITDGLPADDELGKPALSPAKIVDPFSE